MKKQTKNKSINKILIYSIILILIVLFAFVLLRDSFNHYSSFQGHQEYIRNSPSLTIEPWMTPSTILRHFNISESILFNELNISKTNTNLRTPLVDLCKKQKINCPSIVNKLNTLVN
jgi:hypothetical protein